MNTKMRVISGVGIVVVAGAGLAVPVILENGDGKDLPDKLYMWGANDQIPNLENPDFHLIGDQYFSDPTFLQGYTKTSSGYMHDGHHKVGAPYEDATNATITPLKGLEDTIFIDGTVFNYEEYSTGGALANPGWFPTATPGATDVPTSTDTEFYEVGGKYFSTLDLAVAEYTSAGSANGTATITAVPDPVSTSPTNGDTIEIDGVELTYYDTLPTTPGANGDEWQDSTSATFDPTTATEYYKYDAASNANDTYYTNLMEDANAAGTFIPELAGYGPAVLGDLPMTAPTNGDKFTLDGVEYHYEDGTKVVASADVAPEGGVLLPYDGTNAPTQFVGSSLFENSKNLESGTGQPDKGPLTPGLDTFSPNMLLNLYYDGVGGPSNDPVVVGTTPGITTQAQADAVATGFNDASPVININVNIAGTSLPMDLDLTSGAEKLSYNGADTILDPTKFGDATMSLHTLLGSTIEPTAVTSADAFDANWPILSLTDEAGANPMDYIWIPEGYQFAPETTIQAGWYSDARSDVVTTSLRLGTTNGDIVSPSDDYAAAITAATDPWDYADPAQLIAKNTAGDEFFSTEQALMDYVATQTNAATVSKVTTATEFAAPNDGDVISIDGEDYTYTFPPGYTPTAMTTPGFFAAAPTAETDTPEDTSALAFQLGSNYFNDESMFITAAGIAEEDTTPTHGSSISLDGTTLTYADQVNGAALTYPGYFETQPTASQAGDKSPLDDGTITIASANVGAIHGDFHFFTLDKDAQASLDGYVKVTSAIMVNDTDNTYLEINPKDVIAKPTAAGDSVFVNNIEIFAEEDAEAMAKPQLIYE